MSSRSGDFTRESKLDSFATGAAHMSIYLDALLKELETLIVHRAKMQNASASTQMVPASDNRYATTVCRSIRWTSRMGTLAWCMTLGLDRRQ
jgi:hypothetical protein